MKLWQFPGLPPFTTKQWVEDFGLKSSALRDLYRVYKKKGCLSESWNFVIQLMFEAPNELLIKVREFDISCRNVRRRIGLSQVQMESLLCLGVGTFSRWEQAERRKEISPKPRPCTYIVLKFLYFDQQFTLPFLIVRLRRLGTEKRRSHLKQIKQTILWGKIGNL